MWIIAQASSAGWETYGPLGLAVLSLGAFSLKAYKREADRSDRLESDLREFLPMVLRAVDLLNDTMREIRR